MHKQSSHKLKMFSNVFLTHTQIYGFERICIFHQKHICMLWHLFAICIHKLPVILWTPRHSCVQHFRDSADAERFTNASFSAGNLSEANQMSPRRQLALNSAVKTRGFSTQPCFDAFYRPAYDMEIKWVLWGWLAHTRFFLQPCWWSEIATPLHRCWPAQCFETRGGGLTADILSHYFVSWCRRQHSPKELKKSADSPRVTLDKLSRQRGSGKSPDRATKSQSWQPRSWLWWWTHVIGWKEGRHLVG